MQKTGWFGSTVIVEETWIMPFKNPLKSDAITLKVPNNEFRP